MTARPKVEKAYLYDVVFCLNEEWYLIPYAELLDYARQWELCGAPMYRETSHQLFYWLELDDKDIDYLKIILKNHARDIQAFILYDSYYGDTTGKTQGELF